ncbi:C40 family peptidase [Romboutsia maritimum]|nr:SH3 domain-containing C40 family peptidase [Romboutsia maritimum]
MQLNKINLKSRILLKGFAIAMVSISVSLISETKIANALPNDNVKNANYTSQNNINGWIKENNKWYYYEDNTKKVGWFKDKSETWYWLDSNGVMASGEWKIISGKWYRFQDSGKMMNNQWFKDNKGDWYWLKPSGEMASNEILNINKVYYKFLASGKMSDKKDMSVAVVAPCDFLNIRTGVGISYDVVGKVYTGSYVEILDENSEWYKIETGDGIVGWVNADYVVLQGSKAYSDKVQKLLDTAYKQIGKPYVWGASGPSSFDCSGLTSYVYRNAANVTLPRVSRDQATVGTYVNKSQLQAGDLVFFNSDGSSISHVGMYVGDSKFIHSPQPGDVVKVDNLNSSYYTRTFVTARRVLA